MTDETLHIARAAASLDGLPPPSLLRQLLRYEGQTGDLFWLPRDITHFGRIGPCKTWNSRYADKSAFTSVDRHGYKQGHIKGRVYRAHRVIWAMVAGEWPAAFVDLINGARADNTWANLRLATSSENNRNRKPSKSGTSKFLGVSFSSRNRKWCAQIMVDGRSFYLGHFGTEIEAADAYDAACIEHFGEFANPNLQAGKYDRQ